MNILSDPCANRDVLLDLSGSSLSSIAAVIHSLPSLRSFKRLDLSRNELNSLHDLSDLPMLEHLDVSCNRSDVRFSVILRSSRC